MGSVTQPRLTIAIPLYRSARFLEGIVANLEVVVRLGDVEVLVSDRHGEDDTLERLRERYGGDPRFRFFAAADRIDWVAHYAWLLEQGRGRYFAWMPHDDRFPAGYYGGLCDHLDGEPATLLAFGPMTCEDESGREIEPMRALREAPPWDRGDGEWRRRDACRMLRGPAWVAFHGVFRREAVQASGVRLAPTLHNEGADTVWVFGLALRGQVRFVGVPPCTKRYHPGSVTRTTMPLTWWTQTAMFAAAARSLFHHAPSRAGALVALPHLVAAYLVKNIVPRVRRRLRPGWSRGGRRAGARTIPPPRPR